jgi:hypothetical protein
MNGRWTSPAGKRGANGRWMVVVVPKENGQTILAHSEERPFYYNPVGPPLSPIKTPTP